MNRLRDECNGFVKRIALEKKLGNIVLLHERLTIQGSYV